MITTLIVFNVLIGIVAFLGIVGGLVNNNAGPMLFGGIICFATWGSAYILITTFLN